MIESIISAVILALGGWVFNQQSKIVKLEENIKSVDDKFNKTDTTIKELQSEQSNLKTAVYNVDMRIEKKVGETTKDFTDLLHEVNITLEKLNVTMIFLKDEIKEIKNRQINN